MRRDGYGNTRNGFTSRVSCRNGVFRGRKRILLHHQCNRGGRPGCASRLNVDPAHSLPQERSAGRNLITVFFTVNYPHANFFAKRRARSPATAPHRHATHPGQRHAYHDATAGTCRKPLEKSTIRFFREHMRDTCHACAGFMHVTITAGKNLLPDVQRTPLRSPFPATRKAFCANATRSSRHFPTARWRRCRRFIIPTRSVSGRHAIDDGACR